MDIEDDDDGSGTEKIEDSDDETGRTPPFGRSPISKKNDEQMSLGQIARKYNKTATTKFFNKDSDEEEEKPKKAPIKTMNKSKTSVADIDINEKPKKKKTTIDPDAIIKGPLTGYTIVCTGVLDKIGRDEFKDLLKSLGAYYLIPLSKIFSKATESVSKKTSILVTGSILEDKRPVTESRKYKEATDKKVLIMDEDTFENFLIESDLLNQV
jgi:NAD-dependent DNA ligase